ncbi:uncharacterized protein METZ01_LOCUS56061 [marine metagenome]|uniref:Stage V sporulation protein G n=1 Tax=marine metagenome TaxID=408172 RepID=A0A381SLJ7_9ZZZZ
MNFVFMCFGDILKVYGYPLRIQMRIGKYYSQFSRLYKKVNAHCHELQICNNSVTIMNITSVKIYPFDADISQGSLRACADVVLDDSVLIKGFRILASKSGGLFIGMPSKKGKNGKYYDQVEFKTDALKSLLRNQILDAYKEFSL